MDAIVKGLYKKYKVCLGCHKEYGSDKAKDNGYCSKCIYKVSQKDRN